MALENLFAALGDPNRTRMVALLGQKSLTVNELKGHLNISQSSTSQHLKVLLDAGIVAFTKHGNFRIYSLRAQALKEAYQFFDGLWDRDLQQLKTIAEQYEKDARQGDLDQSTD